MSLKQRHIEILNLIIQDDRKLDIKYISEFFNVSERSIRYDIKEINEEFFQNDGNNILEIYEKKLISNIKREDLIALIKLILPQKYMFTSEERTEILLLEILLFREKFTLQELSDELLISKATLRKDIRDINDNIKEYNVSLLVNNNQGYKLVGQESDIRKLMINMLHKHGDLTEELENEKIDQFKIVDLIILDKKRKYFESEDISLYKSLLLKIQKKTNKIITDEAYNALLLHIIVTNNR
ncbi:MAG: helix-turn-helix domain-containing protein, partial [Sebaldella sp.]|nr:helix-turn-helix domain-containing protein [Sebaldella sp.]